MTEQAEQRRYFSERQGRGPKLEPLPLRKIRPMVLGVFDRFREEGYFQEAFGYECVDAGQVNGRLGSNPDGYFLRVIRREGIWPYWAKDPVWYPAREWDQDTMFDVIEVLHDLVSRGTGGRYHDYSDCGWHYDAFDRESGQREFRAELNEILPLGEVAYEINARGQVIESGPSEFRQLVEAPIPHSADDELVAKRIESAVARFRARGADNEERRVAVRELAGVLEVLRPQVKEQLLSADEGALFHIANGFAVRHNRADQRRRYDGATWLRWTFYVYLATIHAVLRTIDRQAQA